MCSGGWDAEALKKLAEERIVNLGSYRSAINLAKDTIFNKLVSQARFYKYDENGKSVEVIMDLEEWDEK